MSIGLPQGDGARQSRMSSPEVSVVIPCYRAAPLARASVETLRLSLPRISRSWEVIVVDDGGGDFRDPEWELDPQVRLLRLPFNQGKGAAVRAGLLVASGKVRIFTDVDLPFGIDEFPVIVELLGRRRLHLVIGDRTLPGSSYHLQLSPLRRLASSVFSQFVGTMVTGGFFDTQCGLKAIRGDVADALCPHLTVNRFAFDVELLYVALRHRLDVKRIPVRLRNNDTSSVRLWRDSLRSALDVMRIKQRQLSGRYDIEALREIVRVDFESVRQVAHSNLPNSEAMTWP